MSGVLLALDTSSTFGSVAVSVDGQVTGRGWILERSTQAAYLVPAIERALDEAGVHRTELEGIVVGRGPGSFTGVRIAAATARGLARALGIPVWARSSLAAAASSHGAQVPETLRTPATPTALELSPEAEAWPRFVLFDARADRLYGGCWRILPDQVEELHAPAAFTLDHFLDLDLPPHILLCGDGAHTHAEVLEAHDHRILPYPAGLPLAEGLLRLHRLDPDRLPDSSDPRWEPDYLRPSQPEREAAEASTASPGAPTGAPTGQP
jgi:tRNA threonylcarbamoyl adenosine modification protein YeaZ